MGSFSLDTNTRLYTSKIQLATLNLDLVRYISGPIVPFEDVENHPSHQLILILTVLHLHEHIVRIIHLTRVGNQKCRGGGLHKLSDQEVWQCDLPVGDLAVIPLVVVLEVLEWVHIREHYLLHNLEGHLDILHHVSADGVKVLGLEVIRDALSLLEGQIGAGERVVHQFQ